MTNCSIKGCDNKYSCRGYCKHHYMQSYAGKIPTLNIYRNKQGEDRRSSKLYDNYLHMLQRCNNPNNSAYKWYGGRGINVCKRWLGIDGYTHFLKDMGPKPTSGHSLDRIDNDKGYSPDNCRWASHIEQARNKRAAARNVSGIRGVNWISHNKKWRAAIKVDGKSINLGEFYSIEPAIEARKQAELKYWSTK